MSHQESRRYSDRIAETHQGWNGALSHKPDDEMKKAIKVVARPHVEPVVHDLFQIAIDCL